ncbi:archaea-specific SMC-related protein [Halosimplex amylolyticum]|uniref:archaea-specific SMC-related protein n=1 Tax=Halosimplex amylolyticum TaxID=3396616 RepID=UPI003F575722
MAQQNPVNSSVQLDVENIGGITETTVKFTPGVTILTGRNATNRTSLIQALMAALGSDQVSLKGDAAEGRVELTVGDTTYTRSLERTNGSVVTGGEPYLEDATLADLFAFLLEGNDARQAVSRNEDLRNIIMRPVDTSEIEGQIDRLKSQRDDIDSQLDEISRLSQQLPELESNRAELTEKIADKKEELDDVEDQLDEIDKDVDDKREEKEEFERKIDELNDVRSELESVRRQIDSQRESLEALRDERNQLESEREDYDEVPDGRVDGIKAEIQRLRDVKSDLDSTVDELQTVTQFNQDLLDGNLDIFNELHDDDNDGDVTDQLVEDGNDLVCWTCGSETDTSQIESMLEDLRELRNQYMDKRGDLEDDINELTQERHSLEEKQRQRSQMDSRLETIKEEIDDREARIDDLTARRGELTNEVEKLEKDVENLQTDDEQDELLDLHKEANRLEVEIDRLESDLESLDDEIEQMEARVGDRDDLEARRENVQAEIEDLRTRVERLEENAVSQFNDHMESVLDILDYENLERIWIERTEEQVRKGRQTITEGRFDLHVVRSTESESVYEDSVDHLSESEREVTGLVFALAGYLVHDVQEEIPFMMLDSVEAIDAPRIADLVEYFDQHAQYLIIALLEEDAQALNDNYQRVTEIDSTS